ncbi:CoA transferase [Dehalococcoidia bacterium]|nr:CoA transferase [Dehalococcoidia bacterium]
MIQGALSDLKVIDLTHYIAGPYCTKLLADFGADVLKIEQPGGDGARKLGPFPGDIPHAEKSGAFLHLNTNKRSIVLDLKKPTAINMLKDMVRDADILVENFHPRVMAAFGLSYDTIETVNPDLVMVSISNFGQTGPYRDYRGSEIVDYALGGSMYSAGVPDRQPLKMGGVVVSYLAGAHAAASAVVAVLGRWVRGHGDHVDISIMETQAGSLDRRMPMLIGYQYTGQVNHRGMLAPPPVRPCKDGYINSQFGLTWMDRISKMLDMPEIAEDPRFTDPVEASKPENAELMEAIYLGWLGEKTMREAWDAAQAAHVLSGPIYTFADVMGDVNFAERGYWEEIGHPVAGSWRYTGLPFSTFNQPKPTRRSAPLLGEHTDEILGEIGRSAREIATLRGRGVVA